MSVIYFRECVFCLLQQSDDDTSNFDTYYTHETARLSTDSDLGEPIPQEDFGGFTFTSP